MGKIFILFILFIFIMSGNISIGFVNDFSSMYFGFF